MNWLRVFVNTDNNVINKKVSPKLTFSLLYLYELLISRLEFFQKASIIF